MNICLRYVCLRVCLRVKEKKIGEKDLKSGTLGKKI